MSDHRRAADASRRHIGRDGSWRTFGWSCRIVRDLAAYFRGAEYQMGYIESYREAIKMRRTGWPDR